MHEATMRQPRFMLTPVVRRRLTLTMLLFPAVLVLILGLIIPAVWLLATSFMKSLGFGMIEKEFTLESYVTALTSTVYWKGILNALTIGGLTAFFSVLLSYPVAYFTSFKLTRGRNIFMFLIIASLFSSYLVRVYAWRTMLGTNGVVNQALMSIGLIDEPLRFILFSRWAVLITLVNVFLPFTILVLTSSMQNISKTMLETSRDLGASPSRTFFKVVLPLTTGGAIGAFLYTYILSAGDYITPQLVGGTSGFMIGTSIANQFVQLGNQPLGAAITFILMILFGLTYVLVSQLRRFRGA
jgi:spermidine/putrescine transport system permease protein